MLFAVNCIKYLFIIACAFDKRVNCVKNADLNAKYSDKLQVIDKRSAVNNESLVENTTEFLARERKVGKLGYDGYFGYYENHKFVRCRPPPILFPDPETDNKTYIIPAYFNYDSRCEYYDENRLRRAGALGLNGTYGYYENGIFRECRPPEGLDRERNSESFVIPPDIAYDEKCVYIGAHPGDAYDFKLINSSSKTCIYVSVSILFVLYLSIMLA